MSLQGLENPILKIYSMSTQGSSKIRGLGFNMGIYWLICFVRIEPKNSERLLEECLILLPKRTHQPVAQLHALESVVTKKMT